LGVGNGLKNAVAGYNHRMEDKEQLGHYITGTFQFFLLISIFFVTILLLFARYIPVINTNISYSYFLYIPTILLFPFTAFNAILQGSLRNGFLSIIGLIRSLWIFAIIALFKIANLDKIIVCAVGFNVFSLIYYIVILFSIKSVYIFSLKKIFDFTAFSYGLDIIKTGLGFFVLQITSLILFNMGNYIIYNWFPGQVASYDVLNNKIFANLLMFFNIGIAVFWPQFTSAMAERDGPRLIKCRRQLLLLLILFIAGVCLAIPLITPFITWWTSGRISVRLMEIIPFAIFNILLAINYYEAVILNASERIKIQIILSSTGTALFIVLIFLLKNFVINSYIVLPAANAFMLFPSLFVYKIYADKIIGSFIQEKK
jgi:O-antigen/teichoic acid export membrane protein